jgi:hypothetical protein
MTKPNGSAKRRLDRERQRPDQPWRCMECGVPVVPGRRTPCKCRGFDAKSLKEEKA